jgi:glycosyltransferase involved in cell wall biosynthesis
MEKLNLGIDAKWFFNGPPSGSMVVRNLTEEIIKNNRDRFNIYLLIAKKYQKQAVEYFPSGTKFVFLPNAPNPLSNAFIVPVAALLKNIKVVFYQNFISTWPHKVFKIAYIHDVLFLDYPQYYTRAELFYFRLMKNLANKADMVITISGSEKKRLMTNHVADNKEIAVVYHGVSDAFKPVIYHTDSLIKSIINTYNLPGRYLLFVGRINIRKNLMNLVKALEFLDDKTIKLLIVGEESNMYTELERYINGGELINRIAFTGHVPEEALHVIYACATIFCFPSYAEGFGLPPLEAMKCGVPVVVSGCTAMPEICGDAAVYVDPDNERDIACKINSLLNDSNLYNEKVKKGLNRAHNFVWEKSANQILTLIDEAHVH